MQLLILAVLILLSKPAIAYETNEWVEVPRSSEAALDNSGLWHVKNVSRQGDIVSFESLSPESEYMKVEGKCSDRWRVVFWGQYNDKGEIEYRLVPGRLWHWHKPKTRERKVLEYVCSTGSSQLRGSHLSPSTREQ